MQRLVRLVAEDDKTRKVYIFAKLDKDWVNNEI